MLKRLTLSGLIAALLALAGTPVSSQQPFPLGFIDPKPILDAAIKEIGSDKLNCVTISGTAYSGALGQQRLAGQGVDWPRVDQLTNYTRTMNWQARTMKEEFDRKPGLAPAGWKFGTGWIDGPLQQNPHQIHMLNASEATPYAWYMDGASGTPVRTEPDIADIYPVELWMNPHGFLKASQLPGANPRASWRWELGEMGRDGPTVIPAKVYIVQITAPGGFTIDATFNSSLNTIQRLHTMVADPMLGDLNYEHEFVFGEIAGTHDGEYKDVGNGIKFPTGWHSHQGYDDNFQTLTFNSGHNAFGGMLDTVRPNVCPDPVTVPASVRNHQFPTQVEVTALADGVYSMALGANYKSVVVEFPRWIAVYEAPRNEEFSLRVIDAIVKLIPNKPIRYVVNSHGHTDAAGGIRTYVHIGATVVTHFKNWPYYNRDVLTYAARTSKPDMVSIWPPTELAEGYVYESIREYFALEDAGRVMRIFWVNPTRHADGMLVAYLPKERLLLESDIVNTNNPMPSTPTPDQESLFKVVRQMGLQVDQIVPIHGKPMSWSDFSTFMTQSK